MVPVEPPEPLDPASGVHRDTSLIGSTPTPRGHHMALVIVLLQCPRRGLFFMSEVPLYKAWEDKPISMTAQRIDALAHGKRRTGVPCT